MKPLVAAVAVLVALGSGVVAQPQENLTPAQVGQVAEWRARAEQGDALSQFMLGGVYLEGFGVPKDVEEATLWYRQAAAQGHARAQNQLGFMYSTGLGVPLNEREAVRWYWLAAEQGFATAQLNLGAMYLAGRGVRQDDLFAYVWFDLGAAGINRESNFELWDAAVKNRTAIEARLTPAQRVEAQNLSLAGPTTALAPALPPSMGGPTPVAQTVESSGTAFVVDPGGFLLTAYHVIEQASSITVSCNGAPAVPAVVASSSIATDLAVLEASADLGTESFLRLSPQRMPSLGDDVFTIGYPTPNLLGTDPKYTNGTVSALSGLRGDASFLQISVPVQPGNSGGPLVNEDGDVIGVVVATAAAPAFIRATDSIPQNINWAVKSAFASVLFEPPAADSTPTADAGTTIIERVTEATCLVRTKVPASEVETTTDSSSVSDGRAVVIEHRHFIGWHLARLTLRGDSLEFREMNNSSHDFVVPASAIDRLEAATDIWGQGQGYYYTLHFLRDTEAGNRITFRTRSTFDFADWLAAHQQ